MFVVVVVHEDVYCCFCLHSGEEVRSGYGVIVFVMETESVARQTTIRQIINMCGTDLRVKTPLSSPMLIAMCSACVSKAG